jgi:hypothetical protein
LRGARVWRAIVPNDSQDEFLRDFLQLKLNHDRGFALYEKQCKRGNGSRDHKDKHPDLP